MLDIVFDMIYHTFWVPPYERSTKKEPYGRLQVLVRQFAARLLRVSQPDGDSVRQVCELIARLEEEIGRLRGVGAVTPEQLSDVRSKLERLRELVARMDGLCVPVQERSE